MSIDIKTVEKIAKLSKLRIPEEEKQKIAENLSSILEWVGQLDEVNVEGIEPLANVNDNKLDCREDIVTDGKKPDDILENAPAQTANFFTVPKVIE